MISQWKHYNALLLIALSIKFVISKKASNETYRLPDMHKPYHYKLDIDLSLESFEGNVTISFTSKEASTLMFLHAGSEHMQIKEVLYGFAHGCNHNISKETEILIINCPTPINAGNSSIVIQFSGGYPENEYLGLYKTVLDHNAIHEEYISSQFEPTFARRAFPCFDEPTFKAQFDVSVTHPREYTAMFNTPSISTVSVSLNKTKTQFTVTPEMSTYALAIVLSKFEKGSWTTLKEKNNFTLDIYARSNMVQYTSTALQYAPTLVNLLGEWTGYKYEEMGDLQINQVAVVDFHYGAMENWGLIIYKEIYLLDEGERTSALQKQNILVTLAHEISHMWFGNLVTLDWWADAWLNEGFATYCQYYITGESKDVLMDLEEQFITDVVQVALDLDAHPSASPLSSKEVETQKQDMAKFDDITYKKGASIIRMMRSDLGYDKFKEAVRAYLKKYRYKNSTPSSLLNVFNDYHNKTINNMTDVMENWIYKSGYPLIKVESQKESVLISQEQFLYISSNGTNDTNYLEDKQWHVPISYTTSKENDFNDGIRVWLKPNESLQISLDGADWILFNVKRTGFYRVNYDDSLWNKIIEDLKGSSSIIHVDNRAQLVDDIFACARTGHVSYDMAFDLADYLKSETEYQPWMSAFSVLKFLFNKLVDDNEATSLLKSMVLGWINTAFESGPNENLTHIEILRDVLIQEWKCKLDDGGCTNTAEKAFEKYMTEDYLEDYNMRKIILCFGIDRNSSTTSQLKNYEKLLQKYVTTDSVLEKSVILSAIGCSENAEVLSRYLSELVSNSTVIRRQDALDVYRAAHSNKAGLNVTLKFLEHHLSEILEKYKGIIEVDNIFTGLTATVTSQEEVDALKRIIARYEGKIEDIELLGDQAISSVTESMEWIDTYKEEIKNILKKRANNSATATATLSVIFVCLSTILSLCF